MIYELPLTKTSGKIRIKERLTFGDYGIPIAPTKTIINQKHYIEWQIGYDEVSNSNDYHFIGFNKKFKKLYELSEILLFGYKNKLISKTDLQNLQNFVSKNQDLIEDKLNIVRTNFKTINFANINFLNSSVSYPLLVYKFDICDMICEIIIKEKQYASGIMPMLYFCLPLSALQNSPVGRTINSKEIGILEINTTNFAIFMQMFKIFGILSKSHKHDCIEILNYITKEDQ